MRSFRAKPVGWRNESYRHYLAAKGISTGHLARKRPRKLKRAFEDQSPYDVHGFKRDRFETKGAKKADIAFKYRFEDFGVEMPDSEMRLWREIRKMERARVQSLSDEEIPGEIKRIEGALKTLGDDEAMEKELGQRSPEFQKRVGLLLEERLRALKERQATPEKFEKDEVPDEVTFKGYYALTKKAQAWKDEQQKRRVQKAIESLQESPEWKKVVEDMEIERALKKRRWKRRREREGEYEEMLKEAREEQEMLDRESAALAEAYGGDPREWKKRIIRRELGWKQLKNYRAYKGATEEEKERMERIFDTNPRLNAKRLKAVRDIVIEDGPTRGEAWFVTDTGDIHLSRRLFNENDAWLKYTLDHEVTHAAQTRKLGHERMKKMIEQEKKLAKGIEVISIDAGEGRSRVQVATPHAISPAERYASGSFDVYTHMVQTNPEVKKSDREFKQEMRKAKKLREFEDVWEE